MATEIKVPSTRVLQTTAASGEGAKILRDFLQQLADGAGGAVTAEERTVYGSFCLVRAGEPWGGTVLPGHAEAHAADIFRNPDTYITSFWDILEVDDATGEVFNNWPRNQFASVEDLQKFVVDNFTEDTLNPGSPQHSAYVRVYDAVDATIPQIDKVYGMNMLYSMLVGRRNYKRSHGHVEDRPDWAAFDSWFTSLRGQNLGFPAGPYVSNAEKALWIARAPIKKYGLPKLGFHISIGVQGTRFVWNDLAADFVPISNTDAFSNDPAPSGQQLVYCALNTDDINTWAWIDSNSVMEFMAEFASMNKSWLAVYPLINTNNPAQRIVFIKPLGIDRAGITWFDETKYDLYAQYTRKDTTPIMRKLDLSTVARKSAIRDLIWLDIKDWRPVNWGTSRARLSTNMLGLQPYTTRFFLRDKITNQTSPISKASIVLSLRGRNAALKYEVRR